MNPFKITIDNPLIYVLDQNTKMKEYIVKKIIDDLKIKIKLILVISQEKFYQTITNDIFIYEKFNLDIIKRLLYRQQLLLDNYEKRKKMGKICLILDCDIDYVAYSKFNIFNELMMNARFHNIIFIIIQNIPQGICPEIRFNLDYYFVATYNSTINSDDLLTKIYEYVNGEKQIVTYEQFSDMYFNNNSFVVSHRKPQTGLFIY